MKTDEMSLTKLEQLHRGIQFKLSSICALYSTTTRPLFFFSTALLCHTRGASRVPSSSGGIKLVKNTSVKNSSSSTRPRKLVPRRTASSDRMILWRTLSRTAQSVSSSLKSYFQLKRKELEESQSAGGCAYG